MLNAEDYFAITGSPVPEAFDQLLAAAEELLHARTLQQYRRAGIPTVPRTAFQRALALQVAYMDSRGGIDAWNDPSAMASWVSIGRFSVNNRLNSGTEDALLSPGAAALLPTLMAYANAWMGEEAGT